MEESTPVNQEGLGGTPTPAPLNAQDSSISETPQIIVAGPVSPGGGKKKILIWIILGFILILILSLGAYLLRSEEAPQLPLNPGDLTQDATLPPGGDRGTPTGTPNFVEGTEDWLVYGKEGKFSFKYPPLSQIKEYSDGSVAVTQWGPTQKEGTEFYDGLSMSFGAFDPKGKTLKKVADEKYLQLKDLLGASRPVVTSVAGQVGYTFETTGDIRADYYFVTVGSSTYLEIINATQDPTNAGFIALAEKILMTVVISQ